MRALMVSMIIGIMAGVIDALPMIIKKMDKRSILSAFSQYFFISIIIVNINLFGIIWWLQGSIIALALSIPVIIIVSEKEPKSVPVIASMSIILGTFISIVGHFLK